MDPKVQYHIEAIDKITPVYKKMISLNNKFTKGLSGTNNKTATVSKSMAALAATSSSATTKINNGTKYGVLRFQRMKKTVDDVEKSVKKSGSSLDWLRGKVGGVERRAAMMGNKVKGGLGTLTRSLGGFGTAMAGIFTLDLIKTTFDTFTNKASDLNESTNKARVVFGSNFDQISKFAENAAKSIGMSKQQTLEATSTFADMFQGMGMGLNKSTKFSEGMVRLAADLGSFHNLSNEDAIAAISSGIRGEMEPLTRVGVVLNDATLKQKAFEMGLISSTKNAMTPAIKAEATIGALIDKTTRAQGDRARTSGDLAAKEKELLSVQANMQASLGQKLLPLKLKFVNLMIKAVGWVERNADKLLYWGEQAIYVAGALTGIYAAAKTVLGVANMYSAVTSAITVLRTSTVLAKIAMIAFNVVARLSPFGWIALAIGGIILLVKHWDTVKVYLAKFAAWMWNNHPFKWMIDLVDRIFPGFKDHLGKMFEAVKKVFLDVAGWIYDKVIKPLFGWLGDIIDGFSFSPTITPTVTPARTRGDLYKKNTTPQFQPFENKTPGPWAPKNDKSANDYYKSILDNGGSLGDAFNDKTKGSGGGGVKENMDGLVSGGGKEMKNINIRIDKLIESFNISTENFGMSVNQIKAEVQKVLLSAVNEVNYQ